MSFKVVLVLFSLLVCALSSSQFDNNERIIKCSISESIKIGDFWNARQLIKFINRSEAESLLTELCKDTNQVHFVEAALEMVALLTISFELNVDELSCLAMAIDAEMPYDFLNGLIALGAAVDGGKGNTVPLVTAVFKGNAEAVKILLAKGANPNTRIVGGYTLVQVSLHGANISKDKSESYQSIHAMLTK